jgi:membrane-associated phospholipid phosphatase
LSRRLAVAFGAALGAVLSPSIAWAESNEPDWAFSEPAMEPVVAGVCAASLLTFLVPQKRSGWGARGEVDPGDLSDLVSDFTGAAGGALFLGATGYVLEAAYYQTDGVRYPFARALKTTMIDVEALALSAGLTAFLKRTAGRCRPRAWRAGVCEDDDDAHTSFPSGHTSAVSGIAGARLVLAARSTGPIEFRLAGFALAETSSIVTAILRVTSGAHSVDDVTAGWILGHVTGSFVAIVHPMERVETQTEVQEAAAPLRVPPLMLGWSGEF